MISLHVRPCACYFSWPHFSGKLLTTLLIALCIASLAEAQFGMGAISPKENRQDFLQNASSSGIPTNDATTDRYFILESQSTDEPAGTRSGRPAAQSPPQPIGEQSQSKNDVRHRRSSILLRAISLPLSHGPSLAHATDLYRSISASPVPNEEKLATALAQPLDLDFGNSGVTLGQFVTLLRDKMAVPVTVDPYVVNEFNIDPNEPPFVTGSYEGIPLRSSIRRALSTYGELPLTLARRDGCLLITEKTYAELYYNSTRIYPVPFESSTSLVRALIQQTLSPTSWNNAGGTGTIMPSGNTLVISQTDEVHEDIEAFLGQREVSLGIAPGHPILRVHHIREPEILEFLAANLTGMCNDALGELGDQQATTRAAASTLTVQSSSRSFLVYAEELISCFQQRENVHYEWRGPVMTKSGIRMDPDTRMLRGNSFDTGGGMLGGTGG